MSGPPTQKGPGPLTHSERVGYAYEVFDRLRARFADRLLACAVYGSVADGSDGPYSDLEMFAVLADDELDETVEWLHGPWKVEVDLLGTRTAEREAAELEIDWALTKRCFVHTRAFQDDGILRRLSEIVRGHPPDAFRPVVERVLVAEVGEYVGKVRNALHAGRASMMPSLAVWLATSGAYLQGLHHRHLFSGSAAMLAEACALDPCPAGYAELCALVGAGELSDARRVARACEEFWAGVRAWAAANGYRLESPVRLPL